MLKIVCVRQATFLFQQSPIVGKDEEDSFDSTSCDEVHYPKWISNSAEDCLSQVWSTIRREQQCGPTRPDPMPIRPKSPGHLAGWVDGVSQREISEIETG